MSKAKVKDTSFLYTCTTCGKEVNLNLYRPGMKLLGIMYHDRDCYDCAYWKDLADNRPAGSVVVEGHLMVPSYSMVNPFLAILKNTVYILCYSGQAIRANNIVSYGFVPARFKHLLPDDGKFVSRRVYQKVHKINKHRFQCRRRGCFDRYHCIFYNVEAMEPDGPWNKIPDKYTPGWEECPSFINKYEIFKQ